MSNETQPTFSKAQEFSTPSVAPKKKSLFSLDFTKKIFAGNIDEAPTWRQRIARFFNPETPKKHSYSKHEATAKSLTPSLPSMQVTQQETDAFRMKAITLMNSHGIPFKSVAEQLKTLRNTPILMNRKSLDAPIISYYQIVSPFPGEIIEFKGSFKRTGDKFSIPIPSSFQIHKQNGFPQTAQHNGWALDPCLVRSNAPQDILERKAFLAKELLPDGALAEQAREHIAKKRVALDPKELVELHRQLAHALVKGNPEMIDAFFDALLNRNDAYDVISSVYEHINQAIFHGKQLPTHEYASFMICVCDALSSAVHNIMNRSPLSDFEKRLEAAAFKQVREFMSTVDVRAQLESDIAIFRS